MFESNIYAFVFRLEHRFVFVFFSDSWNFMNLSFQLREFFGSKENDLKIITHPYSQSFRANNTYVR